MFRVLCVCNRVLFFLINLPDAVQFQYYSSEHRAPQNLEHDTTTVSTWNIRDHTKEKTANLFPYFFTHAQWLQYASSSAITSTNVDYANEKVMERKTALNS